MVFMDHGSDEEPLVDSSDGEEDPGDDEAGAAASDDGPTDAPPGLDDENLDHLLEDAAASEEGDEEGPVEDDPDVAVADEVSTRSHRLSVEDLAPGDTGQEGELS